MDLQMFLVCLLATSVLTGLVTEGIKIVLTEHGKDYKANTLAGIVAVVLSVLISGAYCVFTGAQPDAKMVVTIVALVILSWLCAMVGYDKVIQAIKQFTDKGNVAGSLESEAGSESDGGSHDEGN